MSIAAAAYWIDIPDELVDQLVEEHAIEWCNEHGAWETGTGIDRDPDRLYERIDELADPS